LIKNDRTNAIAAHPPASGMLLIAGTTNWPTSAAAMPRHSPLSHMGAEAGNDGSTRPNAAPQSPPQKHRLAIRGTPNGGIPSVG
jgi:hypothetical protein